MVQMADAVIIGGGPNGLSAGIELARAGKSVILVERAATKGFLGVLCELPPPLGVVLPELREAHRSASGAKAAAFNGRIFSQYFAVIASSA